MILWSTIERKYAIFGSTKWGKLNFPLLLEKKNVEIGLHIAVFSVVFFISEKRMPLIGYGVEIKRKRFLFDLIERDFFEGFNFEDFNQESFYVL